MSPPPRRTPTPLLQLVLPWPDRRLNPNRKVHWAQKAAAVRRARRATAKAADEAGWGAQVWQLLQLVRATVGQLELHLSFHPPDRRRRDDDNLIAAFKPYRDALAARLGVDDSQFRCSAQIGEPCPPKGEVLVSLRLAARA